MRSTRSTAPHPARPRRTCLAFPWPESSGGKFGASRRCTPLGFDLRSFGDLIAHPDEVRPPAGRPASSPDAERRRRPVPWQRHVGDLIGRHAAVPVGLQLQLPADAPRRAALRLADPAPGLGLASGGSAPISELASDQRRPSRSIRPAGRLEFVELFAFFERARRLMDHALHLIGCQRGYSHRSSVFIRCLTYRSCPILHKRQKPKGFMRRIRVRSGVAARAQSPEG